MAESKRRSARVLADRKRSIYYDPGSEDDFDEVDSDEETDPRRERQPSPGPSQQQQHAPPQRARKRRKVDRRPKPETRAKEKRMQRFKGKSGPRKKKNHGVNWIPPTPSKHRDDQVKAFSGPSDGVIPDWTRLPAEIWRDVFIFASQPIHEQTTTATANVTWLMRSARTCRALAVPALEAYYEAPSILNSRHPHDLLALIRKPQDELYINYKHRIKSLDVDVKRLAYAAHNKRPFDLGDLVQELPQLRHLRVLHPVYSPPYRPLKYQPWTYPPDLIDRLEDSGVRLRSWRWSMNLIPPGYKGANLYSWIGQVHRSKAFEYLEHLEICGFYPNDSALNSSQTEPDAPSKPSGLAPAICALPHLKSLTFISCDSVVEDFLEHIPNNLERLELSNCLEITTSMMYTYLALGGSQLRELVLNHNASLSLAFTENLKPLCPRLEVLKADLTCYSERMNYNDSVALYDHVLTDDQVPTWPMSLRHLELKNLQKWDAEAAQNLFRSLVDGAKDLPKLRYLALQAHINIPWRDRAGFRDQWIERLQRVFLRQKDEPNPNRGSLKQIRLWKQTQRSNLGEEASQNHQTPTKGADSSGDGQIRRKMAHVRVTPRERPAATAVYSGTESPATKQLRARPRRSVRVAESQSASTAAEESSSESESEADDDWRRQPESFIQGLCDVVDIRIDNQRPRENQFTEANFLDSEPSGDEDWQEGQELSDDDPYAW